MVRASIACVVTNEGKVFTCGPDDFGDEFSDQFVAAECWAREAGNSVVSTYCVLVDLPKPKPRDGNAIYVREVISDQEGGD